MVKGSRQGASAQQTDQIIQFSLAEITCDLTRVADGAVQNRCRLDLAIEDDRQPPLDILAGEVEEPRGARPLEGETYGRLTTAAWSAVDILQILAGNLLAGLWIADEHKVLHGLAATLILYRHERSTAELRGDIASVNQDPVHLGGLVGLVEDVAFVAGIKEALAQFNPAVGMAPHAGGIAHLEEPGLLNGLAILKLDAFLGLLGGLAGKFAVFLQLLRGIAGKLFEIFLSRIHRLPVIGAGGKDRELQQTLLGDQVLDGFNLVLRQALAHPAGGGGIVTDQLLKFFIGSPGVAGGRLQANEIIGGHIGDAGGFVCRD